jgi:hypothetical protein
MEKLIELSLDRVRKIAEQSDSFGAMFIHHSIAGGMGSGFT